MFELYKSEKSGDYFFRLKAANGEIILSSQGYKDKAGCENGIASVKTNAPDDKNYVTKDAADGTQFFNLNAANGQVIGKSQMYKSASGIENGVESVKKNAAEIGRASCRERV